MHMEVPQILGRPSRSIQQGAARSPTWQTVLTGTGQAEAPTLNWVPGKQRSLASTGLGRIPRRGWGQDWPGKTRVFKLLQSKLAFLVLRTLLEAGVWVTLMQGSIAQWSPPLHSAKGKLNLVWERPRAPPSAAVLRSGCWSWGVVRPRLQVEEPQPPDF